MTFNISPKDKLQKSDYNNPYQNHVEESRLRASRIAEAKERDLAESQAVKKEREIIERYLKGYFSDETLQLSAFQIVGKLVFFLVLMPPFFIVFTVPKWLYQKIVEKGETLAENIDKKVIAMMRPVINWAIAEWNLLAEQLGMRGKQIAALFTKSAHFFSKMVERLLARFQTQAGAVSSSLKENISAVLSFVKTMGQKVADPVISLFSEAKAFLEKIKAQFSKLDASELKDSVLDRAKEMLKNIKDKVAGIPEALSQDGKEVVQGAKFLADLSLMGVYKAAEIVTNMIVPFATSFTSPLVEGARDKMNLAANVAKSLLHAAQAQIERFQGFLVLKYQEAAALFANLFQPLFARGKQFSSRMAKAALYPFKASISRFKSSSRGFLVKLREIMKRGLQAIKEKLQEKRDRFVAFLLASKKNLLRARAFFQESLSKKRRAFFQFFDIVKEKIVFFFEQLLFALSTLFLIFKVFVKIAFQRAFYPHS